MNKCLEMYICKNDTLCRVFMVDSFADNAMEIFITDKTTALHLINMMITFASNNSVLMFIRTANEYDNDRCRILSDERYKYHPMTFD